MLEPPPLPPLPVVGYFSETWEVRQVMSAKQWVVQVLKEVYVIPFHAHSRLSMTPISLASYHPDSSEIQSPGLGGADVAEGSN